MRQILISDLIHEKGVCFQVNPETSAEFQKAFFEHCDLDPDNAQEAWQVGFIGITSDGKINFSCRPNYDNEQVILAPEKFNSQKEFMEFLVMGGEVVRDDGMTVLFDQYGCFLVTGTGGGKNKYIPNFEFVSKWKPRIDKPKPK